MKLISLNTWGGRIRKIDEFIKNHSSETDIFCFQEIYINKSQKADMSVGERPELFEELQILLPDFKGIFAEQAPGTGLAMFIRNTLEIYNISSCFLLTDQDLSQLKASTGRTYYPRIVQIVRLKNHNLTILNFHGVPGNEKKDSPERFLQMKKLHEVIDSDSAEKILVGDFNLRPDTEAINGLETKMKNLVIEGGFKTTRTSLYERKESMPFADYTFVTPGIQVKHFEVLPDEVSDHSPMWLDFTK